MKRPAFQFYPGDWRRDAALQSCSITARGVWIELLCVMHECEPYGHLMINGRAVDDVQAARLIGVSIREYRQAVAELLGAGACARTAEGAIYSRRMVRDEQVRQLRASGGELGAEHGAKGAEHGLKGGRPRSVTHAEGAEKTPLKTPLPHDEQPPNKPPPSSSSSSSSSPVGVGEGGGVEGGTAAKPAEPDGAGSAATTAAGSAEPEGQKTAPAKADRAFGVRFDGEVFDVSEAALARWLEAYPGVDIGRELAKYEEWLRCNPTRKPHNPYRGCSAWLAKAQRWAERDSMRSTPQPLRRHTARPGESAEVYRIRRASEHG